MTVAADPATTDAAEPPLYPMPRASGCPLDPAPGLRAEQERGPLTRVRIWDGSTHWLVTRYPEQRALLADRRVSSDIHRPGFPNSARVTTSENSVGFILMDDPEHARLRRMVTAPFAVRRIEAMRPRVQQIVDELIDDLLAGPRPVDLIEAFALPVPSLVICELLGVPYADHDFFQQQSRLLVTVDSDPVERDAALGRLAAYLADLVERRRHDPQEDLLSGLATRVGDGELTLRDAAGIGVLLLIAGHETTANMIGLGTLALLNHPEQLATVRAAEDRATIVSTVEELLRYLNITHNGRRRVALEDIEIAGHTIRAGEGIVVPGEIGNRDPDTFADPDRLDVERDARRHVAFGFGVHQCLGQSLARMELQVVYGTLYRRIPTLALAVDPQDVSFKHESAVYGVHALPVTW